MGSKGDTNFQTRWYWRCDACEYIRKRYEQYYSIFKSQSIPLQDLNYYGFIFEAAMGLNKMFEKKITCLPMVFNLFLQYFEYIHWMTSF